MAAMAAILDFRSTILATFDLQVTMMLPSKFGVNWPFGSGEAFRFKRRSKNDATMMLPSKFGVNWPFGSGEAFRFKRRSEK